MSLAKGTSLKYNQMSIFPHPQPRLPDARVYREYADSARRRLHTVGDLNATKDSSSERYSRKGLPAAPTGCVTQSQPCPEASPSTRPGTPEGRHARFRLTPVPMSSTPVGHHTSLMTPSMSPRADSLAKESKVKSLRLLLKFPFPSPTLSAVAVRKTPSSPSRAFLSRQEPPSTPSTAALSVVSQKLCTDLSVTTVRDEIDQHDQKKKGISQCLFDAENLTRQGLTTPASSAARIPHQISPSPASLDAINHETLAKTTADIQYARGLSVEVESTGSLEKNEASTDISGAREGHNEEERETKLADNGVNGDDIWQALQKAPSNRRYFSSSSPGAWCHQAADDDCASVSTTDMSSCMLPAAIRSAGYSADFPSACFSSDDTCIHDSCRDSSLATSFSESEVQYPVSRRAGAERSSISTRTESTHQSSIAECTISQASHDLCSDLSRISLDEASSEVRNKIEDILSVDTVNEEEFQRKLFESDLLALPAGIRSSMLLLDQMESSDSRGQQPETKETTLAEQPYADWISQLLKTLEERRIRYGEESLVVPLAHSEDSKHLQSCPQYLNPPSQATACTSSHMDRSKAFRWTATNLYTSDRPQQGFADNTLFDRSSLSSETKMGSSNNYNKKRLCKLRDPMSEVFDCSSRLRRQASNAAFSLSSDVSDPYIFNGTPASVGNDATSMQDQASTARSSPNATPRARPIRVSRSRTSSVGSTKARPLGENARLAAYAVHMNMLQVPPGKSPQR